MSTLFGSSKKICEVIEEYRLLPDTYESKSISKEKAQK
jgi:hypothetical protein